MSPEFDPARVSIMSGWLVYDVGRHTCGGYGPGSGYAHEPGCGFEPMVKVAELPALLDAAEERDALRAERDAQREEAEGWRDLCDHWRARADAACAAVERVRAVHARYFDLDEKPGDANPEPEDVWRFDRDLRAALDVFREGR